jgi:hypothetical protein
MISGGSNVNNNNQIALNQQRELAKNVAAAQLNNAATIGRQVNRSEDDAKKTAALQSPQEKVTLTSTTAQPEAESGVQGESPNPATAQESTVSGATGQAGETAQATESTTSRSAEALSTFTDSLFGLQGENKQELEDIVTQSAMVDTSALPAGEAGREVALAATALRTALAKLQEKMPNASKEQIREAAKRDPEIAKWAAIADSAGNYLNAVKGESPQAVAQATDAAGNPAAAPAAGDPAAPTDGQQPGAPGAPPDAQQPGGPGGPPPQNPFRLNPEMQAQMFADNVKTMQSIMNIYQQMWAEISKARAQRCQLVLETANTINQMMMETHVNRMKTSEEHRKAVMAVICECGGKM